MTDMTTGKGPSRSQPSDARIIEELVADYRQFIRQCFSRNTPMAAG